MIYQFQMLVHLIARHNKILPWVPVNTSYQKFLKVKSYSLFSNSPKKPKKQKTRKNNIEHVFVSIVTIRKLNGKFPPQLQDWNFNVVNCLPQPVWSFGGCTKEHVERVQCQHLRTSQSHKYVLFRLTPNYLHVQVKLTLLNHTIYNLISFSLL